MALNKPIPKDNLASRGTEIFISLNTPTPTADPDNTGEFLPIGADEYNAVTGMNRVPTPTGLGTVDPLASSTDVDTYDGDVPFADTPTRQELPLTSILSLSSQAQKDLQTAAESGEDITVKYVFNGKKGASITKWFIGTVLGAQLSPPLGNGVELSSPIKVLGNVTTVVVEATS